MQSSSLNNMCRCCATEGAFKDIKTSYIWMGEEEVYGDMLRECFDVTLTSLEQGGICEVCITQLRNAANFKKQVLLTENQFKKHLQNKTFKNTQVKEELSGFEENDSEDNDMDNIDDEDYVPDYEVPIKTESDSEEKPKKRSAKTPATRGKKSKSNDDSNIKNSRRSSSEESDTPLIFVETNRLTLDRNVNFTSFISILPTEAKKKSHSTEEKPKKAEKRKEIIINEIFEPMDVEPIISDVEEPPPKLKEPKQKRKSQLKPGRPKRKAPRQREVTEEKIRKRPVTEIEWHLENIKVILNSSNATPIRSKEGQNGEYQCSYCKLHFEKLTDLKIHTLTSKSHKKKKPDFLKIHYASLSKHIVYLDITALQCSICNMEMVSLESLMEHLKNDHDENMHLVIKNQIMPLRVIDEKLTCSVCGTELEFEGIQEHMAQHYRNYVCEFCDTSFVIRCKMIEHKKAVHDL